MLEVLKRAKSFDEIILYQLFKTDEEFFKKIMKRKS